jgi:Tfp pilus assembly protein PilF
MTRSTLVSSCRVLIAAITLATAGVRPGAAAQDRPGPPEPGSAGVLAEARQLINEGKPRVAIERLEGAADRTRPDVGRFAEAVPFLEATRAWAANRELGYVLGQAYVQTHRPDRAREVFADTFAVAPDSAAAHLITAQMMIRLEFEEFAEKELTRAIEKDPTLPQAHALLGQVAIFRGRLDEGIRLTRQEIALNPGNAMAFQQLGDALVRQGNWDEGMTALQQSIWLNPFYSAPYIVLGRAYMQKGQPATAEGMLTRAIQYDPNNRTAHYLLGQLYQQMGRLEEAKREFAIADRLQGQPGR